MLLSDYQLNILANLGYSDSYILKFAHENSTPADLYGAVAEVVMKVLFNDEDIMEQLKQANPKSPMGYLKKTVEAIKADELMQEVAEWWKELKINRTDAKNIVMTYLYGSTEYGNRDSIQERIDKRAEEILEQDLNPYFDRSGADVWKDHRSKAITVMVKLIRSAMGVVCPSTVSTMGYIQRMAVALGAKDLPLKVKNPLGFIFHQANPNTESKPVEIWEKGRRVMRLFYRLPNKTGKRLNENKMKAGSAPDFVHTHDACHLALSTLKCDSTYFHHIHDSMATQCADTPNLEKASREAFCDMYAQQDTLQNLYDLNGGASNYLETPPKLGDLKVEDVVGSRYFFS